MGYQGASVMFSHEVSATVLVVVVADVVVDIVGGIGGMLTMCVSCWR